MRLTRRTAVVGLGDQEYTVTELSAAEAEAVEDLWTAAPNQKLRPLRTTAECLVKGLKARHPEVTAAQLLEVATARQLLDAMQVLSKVSSLEEDGKGEA